MNLNYKKFGQGEPIIILHGLFGSLDNWITIAKKLGESFEVFVLDARNHGKSPHSEDLNYDLMADDLYEFLLQNHIVDPIILGHSMGGKTAMQFAMSYPNRLTKLIVADISLREYPVHHRSIIDSMLSLDFNEVSSRKEVEQHLAKSIDDWSTRQFLMKNLYWSAPNQLAWKFNLSTINREIEQVGKAINTTIIFENPTLFISGEKSSYITNEDLIHIKHTFPNAIVSYVNSGHWVHAEQPDEFINVVLDFLNQ